MRPIFRLGLAAAVTASAGLVAVMAWPIGQPLQALDIQGDVNRGAYLARASGCIACHTDFAKGGAPLAGGVELDTPFGTLFSPNLTTDPDHGIGDWTIEEFARAVRQGVSPGGQRVDDVRVGARFGHDGRRIHDGRRFYDGWRDDGRQSRSSTTV